MAVTDDTGPVESHQYDVFGVPLDQSDSLFRYTGQIQLRGTDLYHYKARAYHPGLGRFLQTDPIGYDDGMNLYAYVGNDPVNAIDPSGKKDMSTHAKFIYSTGLSGGYSKSDEWSQFQHPATVENDIAIRTGTAEFFAGIAESAVEAVAGLASGATFHLAENLVKNQLENLSVDGMEYSSSSSAFWLGDKAGNTLSIQMLGYGAYGTGSFVYQALNTPGTARALWMSAELMTETGTVLQATRISNMHPAAGYIVPAVTNAVRIPLRPQATHILLKP